MSFWELLIGNKKHSSNMSVCQSASIVSIKFLASSQSRGRRLGLTVLEGTRGRGRRLSSRPCYALLSPEMSRDAEVTL